MCSELDIAVTVLDQVLFRSISLLLFQLDRFFDLQIEVFPVRRSSRLSCSILLPLWVSRVVFPSVPFVGSTITADVVEFAVDT